MRKSKRSTKYMAEQRLDARRIVRLCTVIARKDVPEALAVIIENHIIARLPHPLTRRLADWGRPMREAMTLTVPFLCECDESV